MKRLALKHLSTGKLLTSLALSAVILAACAPGQRLGSPDPSKAINAFYEESRRQAQIINDEREYDAFLNRFGDSCKRIRSQHGWKYNPRCWRTYSELVSVGEAKGFTADPHNGSEAKRAEQRAERERRARERAEARRRAAEAPREPTRDRHPACDRPGSAAYVVASSRGLC